MTWMPRDDQDDWDDQERLGMTGMTAMTSNDQGCLGLQDKTENAKLNMAKL